VFFKNLGTGVGLRSPHTSLFLESPPKTVSWVEVISENYMMWENGLLPNHPAAQIEKIRKNLPIALHGVSLSIGSADTIDMGYLKRLKELINRVEPHHISDHLCWTGVEGENAHDLLPLPFTAKAIALIVNKIKKTQDFLGRQILLENLSSYVEFESSEMTEWEFLKEVASRSDCGILLDINNVYVSSVNHRFDPLTYLNEIPFERVGQIHLAGHTKQGSLLVDTHDEPVSPEVWLLFKWYSENKGGVSTMIERDDNIPKWFVLEKEIIKARDLGRPKKRISYGAKGLRAASKTI
jgi:uncharacterized protein